MCLRYERTEEAKKVRKQYEAHELTHGFHELSEMQPRQDGKTNTLSTVLKDNPIAEPVNTATWGGQDKSQTIKAQYQQTSPRNICCYTSTYGATGVAEYVGGFKDE